MNSSGVPPICKFRVDKCTKKAAERKRVRHFPSGLLLYVVVVKVH